MSEDMTPGEVSRTLNRVDAGIREMRQSIDGWREIVIKLEHQVAENQKDIASIREDNKEAERARVRDRRLIFTALVAPTIVVVFSVALQIVLTASGFL